MAQGLPGSEKRAENQIGSKQDIFENHQLNSKHIQPGKKTNMLKTPASCMMLRCLLSSLGALCVWGRWPYVQASPLKQCPCRK